MPEVGDQLDLLSILVATIQDISFWTGFVTIIVFSQGRFNERWIDHEELDPPLPARSFTTRFRYLSAASLYTGAYVTLYCALVILGSLPELQGVLKDLFGSFQSVGYAGSSASGTAPGGTEGSAELGTPAWAAMVLMVIAPTIPWMRQAEGRFRLWLHEFSHIPLKARELADDMLNALSASRGLGPRFDAVATKDLPQIYEHLESLRRRLCDKGHMRRSERYRRFFQQNEELLHHTDERFDRVADELQVVYKALRHGDDDEDGSSADPAREDPAEPPLTGELPVLTRRYARLLACALLQIEAEEFYVRKALRRLPGLADLPVADFRFTHLQVVLGFLAIVALAEVVGVGSAYITNVRIIGAAFTPAELWDMITYWLGWGLLSALTFILPLTFAAAIYLYLADLRYPLDDWDWSQTAGALLLAFVSCYGLALLPIVAVQAWWANQLGELIGLLEAMMRAVPPACVSVLYIYLSIRPDGRNRVVRAIEDVVAFAAATGVPATGAALLLVVRTMANAGESTFDAFNTYLVTLWFAPLATVTVIGAVFGALQCLVSRQASERRHYRREAEGLRLQPS